MQKLWCASTRRGLRDGIHLLIDCLRRQIDVNPEKVALKIVSRLLVIKDILCYFFFLYCHGISKPQKYKIINHILGIVVTIKNFKIYVHIIQYILFYLECDLEELQNNPLLMFTVSKYHIIQVDYMFTGCVNIN